MAYMDECGIEGGNKLTLHKYYCDVCGKQLTVHIKSTHTFSSKTGDPLYVVEYACDKSRWYNRHTRWYYERTCWDSYHYGSYPLSMIDLANSETDYWLDDLLCKSSANAS
jgi:hypothetical protein